MNVLPESGSKPETQAPLAEPIYVVIFAKIKASADVIQVQSALNSMSEVGMALFTTGEYEVLILVRAANAKNIGEFVMKLDEMPIIKSKTIFSYTSMVPVNWLLEAIDKPI